MTGKMNETIIEQELNEWFGLLEGSGMNPSLCDTPVPYTEQMVRAGIPSMPGDPRPGEYVMMPRELVGCCPMFLIDVIGDSMSDVGIMPGDRLRVQMDVKVEDGDIVIACVDGECTVKAYLRDGDGRRWLVPRNDKYRPLLLTEEMDVRILGRVVEHIRQAPRVSYNELVRSIRQARPAASLSPSEMEQRVMDIIREVAHMVKCRRHWYAVYRPLLDCGLLGQDAYMRFSELVRRSVPDHTQLPSRDNLRRMAVQSFARPIAKWDPQDAPVSGVRFEEYLAIARATARAEAIRGALPH